MFADFFILVCHFIVHHLGATWLIFHLSVGVHLIWIDISTLISYKFNQMTLSSTLKIQRHVYFVHFYFVTLFIDI